MSPAGTDFQSASWPIEQKELHNTQTGRLRQRNLRKTTTWSHLQNNTQASECPTVVLMKFANIINYSCEIGNRRLKISSNMLITDIYFCYYFTPV